MVFKKKSKAAAEAGTDEQAVDAAAQPDSKKGRRAVTKRPAELLSSVVKESVVGPAFDLMLSNKNFLLPGNIPVIATLDVTTIGGLSQRNKGDEAKGAIVALIEADSIATAVTAEMLSYETLGLIPVPDTLERMREFGILTDATYSLTTFVVGDDGTVDANPVEYATFAQLESISNGTLKLADAVPTAVWDWAEELRVWKGGAPSEPVVDEDDPADEEDLDGLEAAEAAAVAEDEADEVSDEIAPEFAGDEDEDDPVINDVDEEDPVGDEIDDAPELEEPAGYAETDYDSDEDAEGDADLPETDGGSEYEQYTDAMAGQEFDETSIRNVLARRFLPNDLNIELSLEGFDEIFADQAPEEVFAQVDASTPWLADQVNQYASQANAELARLRADHRAKLRTRYVTLMSNHIDQVIADTDLSREGSFYHDLLLNSKADYDSALQNVEKDSTEERKRIEAAFQQEVEARGEQARIEAQNRYRDRHRPQHSRALAEVSANMVRKAEETYAAARQTALEVRSSTAFTQVSVGETRILELLQEQSEENMAIEQNLIRGWSESISDFADANRKDDIARSEALQAQLAREDTVEAMRLRSESRVAELEEARARAVADLEARLASERAAFNAELEARDRAHDSAIEVERGRTETVSNQSAHFLSLAKDAEEKNRENFSKTILELKESNEAAEKQRDRSVWTMRMVAIVGIVAALMAGGVAGVGLASSWFGEKTPAPVVLDLGK